MFPGGGNTWGDASSPMWFLFAHRVTSGALVPLALIKKSRPEPCHVVWPQQKGCVSPFLLDPLQGSVGLGVGGTVGQAQETALAGKLPRGYQ